MHIEAAHQVATGKNITIAVIDTGVDDSHPDLTGQISLEQNFVAQSPETHKDIHGTAVAGVIAATANNRQGIVGVAPGAKLLALKACWPVVPLKPEAMCNSLSLSLALDRVISLKPQIVNLSLTGREDPLVGRLVNKALEAGIIVVASAGAAGEVYFPASVPGVVAVHAAGEHKPGTIAAPDQEILTTLPNSSYNFMSGSSFSAAHVSGLIALLLELKSHLTPAQIIALLLASMPPPSTAPTLNSVDICAALAKAGGLIHCGGPTAKAESSPPAFAFVTRAP
jgi:subtilisin family serine protease